MIDRREVLKGTTALAALPLVLFAPVRSGWVPCACDFCSGLMDKGLEMVDAGWIPAIEFPDGVTTLTVLHKRGDKLPPGFNSWNVQMLNSRT